VPVKKLSIMLITLPVSPLCSKVPGLPPITRMGVIERAAEIAHLIGVIVPLF
jgi:hypothetical protein